MNSMETDADEIFPDGMTKTVWELAEVTYLWAKAQEEKILRFPACGQIVNDIMQPIYVKGHYFLRKTLEGTAQDSFSLAARELGGINADEWLVVTKALIATKGKVRYTTSNAGPIWDVLNESLNASDRELTEVGHIKTEAKIERYAREIEREEHIKLKKHLKELSDKKKREKKEAKREAKKVAVKHTTKKTSARKAPKPQKVTAKQVKTDTVVSPSVKKAREILEAQKAPTVNAGAIISFAKGVKNGNI